MALRADGMGMDLPGFLDRVASGRHKGGDVPHGLGWRSPFERLFFLSLASLFTVGALVFAVYGLIVHEPTASVSGLAGGAAGLMLSRMVPDPVPSPGRKWRRRGGAGRSPSVYGETHEGEDSMTADSR